MDNIFFSIVTPTFNSEKYLEECILSIKNQTYADFEHIIVDGGSTDSTLQIIQKYEGTYNMRYISEPDNGMYDAIVKGFEMAKGNVFCWLNSDDMYAKGALEIVAYAMNKYSVDWCTGVPSKYDEKGVNYGVKRHTTVFYPAFLRKGWYDGRLLNVIQQESTFWTRSLWESVDYAKIAEYDYAGDYMLWKMFGKKAELYSIDCVLAGFRKHADQKSSNIKAYRDEQGALNGLEKILKKTRLLKMVHAINMILDKKHYIRYKM